MKGPPDWQPRTLDSRLDRRCSGVIFEGAATASATEFVGPGVSHERFRLVRRQLETFVPVFRGGHIEHPRHFVVERPLTTWHRGTAVAVNLPPAHEAVSLDEKTQRQVCGFGDSDARRNRDPHGRNVLSRAHRNGSAGHIDAVVAQSDS